MNKKAARYGLYFYLLTMILFLLFPKQLAGNISIVVLYLISCVTFLYFIYFKKSTDTK